MCGQMKKRKKNWREMAEIQVPSVKIGDASEVEMHRHNQ